ncbi:prolyl oligopeptidase family serine peptidase [Saccharomonospora xinjiangensis]|uniref:Serine protease, S9A family peptidase n=1 Tax=Saccharomonospora xinjiangensis XJ-54 TaxID=882086 RepID=I0V6A0_9PSEU|nr:prolyl oligopeptidase family serine peptidase [Saccharomonospora xinjiangensis]EID55653.1 serine protease, S9A family peptidase [Saccharomonospora xinjiangensis XJ-54]
MDEFDPSVGPDPHRWLEDVTGEDVLDWVRGHNAATVARYAAGERFERIRDELREVLDADTRIPYVRRRGAHLYNFWRDARHPRGLWRRTTLDSYRTADPEWEILLDIDALAAEESENWVWQGATVLRPGFHRCLVELSRGGADATVVREFDLERRVFVDDGFTLPEAKSSVCWIDEDRIYVGTDFGEGSLTTSGYPRLVKEWRRGTPLEEATLVFEGKPDDVSVHAVHDPTEGWERDLVSRAIDFYRSEAHLRTTDGLVRIDVPDDASVSAHRQWLLIRTRSPWTVEGSHYPAGALLGIELDAFLAGDRSLTVLFEPDAHTSLDYYAWTRDHLLLGTLVDVKTRLRVLTPGPQGWHDEPLTGLADVGAVDLVATDPYDSDEFFVEATGYTDPPALLRGEVGSSVETVKRTPAFFDADSLDVTQHFATSEDGTRIPYFVVGPKDRGTVTPTLLTGYGGFEVSLTPSYSGVIGRGWLARGGTYVVANLRGGGEYGPDWHNQVVKTNRLKVYEDFAAVARDVVARGITTPELLGVQGGSNGGLLTGVMLTRYPELVGAVVSQVPLLDMRRYHQLLAGASWMAEYGDPDDPEEWAYLSRYSPYHNVHSGRTYPPTLFVTSTRDDRVHPAHARKMMARMHADDHDVAYYENLEGGHGAAADNAQLAFMWALVFEFLWQRLSDESEPTRRGGPGT